MKMFLTLLAFVSFTHVFAQESYTAINDGDKTLSGAIAEITSVKPICPKVPGQMSCMAYGSNVKLKVLLGSCVDSFGGYFSSFKVVNGKGILSLGAININNENAIRVRCLQASYKMVSVFVPFEGKVTLENMDYQGEIIPAL